MTTVFNNWFPASFYGSDHVNVKSFGAIGNGNVNLLTSLGFTSTANAKNGVGGNGIAYPKCTDYLTDSADWCGIQAAVDYALYNHIIRVYMPNGRYYTTDTIHLGYGMRGGTSFFECVQLEGAGWAGISGQLIGTTIFPQFKDRPCINIQAGRQSGVRRLAIVGKDYPVENNYYTPFDIKSDPANYKPVGAQDFPKAPLCGICVDAYFPGGGFAPGEASNTPPPGGGYPAPRFPPWVQSTTNAYNKGASSQMFIRDCSIYGTNVGVMLHPYGDANGDFIRCTDTSVSNCAVAFAAGNAQGRLADYSNCNIYACHTAFDASTYGNNIANMQGTYDNVCVDYCYQAFNIIYAPGGPISVHGLYGEGVTKLGTVIGNVTFDDCFISSHDCMVVDESVSLSSITVSGGIATATTTSSTGLTDVGWTWGTHDVTITASPSGYSTGVVEGTWIAANRFTYAIAGTPSAFVSGSANIRHITEWRQEPFFTGRNAHFRSCQFSSRTLYHFVGKVSFFNTTFLGESGSGNSSGGGLFTQGHRKALAALGRVVITQDILERADKGPWSGHIFQSFGRTADLSEGSISWNGHNSREGWNLWGFGQNDDNYAFEYDVPSMSRFSTLTVSVNGPVSGITRTFTAPGHKAEIGDIIHMYSDKAWYCVNSISGDDLVCQMITQFKRTAGVYSPLFGADGLGTAHHYYPIGVLDFVPSRASGPAPTDVFFKTTATSAVLALVQADGSAVSAMPPGISLTSKPLWFAGAVRFWANSLPFPAATTISSIDTTAKTLTMSQPANTTGTWAYGPGIKRLK